MNVLLSIKPKFVEEIINGDKKYEFRKQIFKDRSDKIAFIYATAPLKKIVGHFHLNDIVEDEPKYLWKRFSDVSGLNEDEFFNYFLGKKLGYAIRIHQFELFAKPIDPYSVIKNFIPPQSFCYVSHPLTKIIASS